MECTRCLFTDEIAKIHPDGECEYCKLHDKLEQQANPDDLLPILTKIKKQGAINKYDCLIGISGGLDSSTLLFLAVKAWGLRPLVIHFDNHYNSPIAQHNMDMLIKRLPVDCITYMVNRDEYDDLNLAFLLSGVPDADIPNDIAMTKLMYETADRHGIKYILNGHDFRQEGSTPAKWTYMDAKYIRSIYEAFKRKPLKNYPLFTFKDQIIYALKGIKQVRPFHYMTDAQRTKWEQMMIEMMDWKSYGGKHCENGYTEFVGSWLLPRKFGIDKRIVYLSARVRSGLTTKAKARLELSKKTDFNFDKLGENRDDIESMLMKAAHNPTRTGYEKYNFKKYRPLIWLLAKMKVVPFTFYSKYCK
jgi:hypothetical protein